MQIFPYKLLAAGLLMHKLLRTYTPQTTTKFFNQSEDSSGVQQQLSIKLGKGEAKRSSFVLNVVVLLRSTATKSSATWNASVNSQ